MIAVHRAAGAEVTLKLKEGEAGPVEHAQALYKRAAKQRRAKQHAGPLIEDARWQLEYLQGVQQSLRDLQRRAGPARGVALVLSM